MSREELFAEVRADEMWVLGRLDGLRKKYNKQLKSKAYGHMSILGRTWYQTPNGNRVYTIVQKFFYDEKCKYADVSLVTLYEYDYGDKKRYLYPIYYRASNVFKHVIIFTDHAIDRMKQRLGKGILEVFEDICVKQDTACCFVKYDYNGADDEFMGRISDGVAFARIHKWGLIVSTIISTEQEYTNQLVIDAASRRDILDISKEQVDRHNDVFMTHKALVKSICKKQTA